MKAESHQDQAALLESALFGTDPASEDLVRAGRGAESTRAIRLCVRRSRLYTGRQLEDFACVSET